MDNPKFISIPTHNDFVLVNIQNIASVESDGIESLVRLNITDETGQYIVIKSRQIASKLKQDISVLAAQK